jgi:hypothetical protein
VCVCVCVLLVNVHMPEPCYSNSFRPIGIKFDFSRGISRTGNYLWLVCVKEKVRLPGLCVCVCVCEGISIDIGGVPVVSRVLSTPSEFRLAIGFILSY